MYMYDFALFKVFENVILNRLVKPINIMTVVKP